MRSSSLARTFLSLITQLCRSPAFKRKLAARCPSCPGSVRHVGRHATTSHVLCKQSVRQIDFSRNRFALHARLRSRFITVTAKDALPPTCCPCRCSTADPTRTDAQERSRGNLPRFVDLNKTCASRGRTISSTLKSDRPLDCLQVLGRGHAKCRSSRSQRKDRCRAALETLHRPSRQLRQIESSKLRVVAAPAASMAARHVFQVHTRHFTILAFGGRGWLRHKAQVDLAMTVRAIGSTRRAAANLRGPQSPSFVEHLM